MYSMTGNDVSGFVTIDLSYSNFTSYSCETVVADPSTVKGALIVEGSISSSNEIRVAYDEAGGGNCSVGSLGVKNINALNVYTGNIRYEAVDQTERCCCRSSGRGNACAANESAHP